MPVMTGYPHGVPSWVDLASPDVAASKAFYAELFGWEYTDEPTDQEGMDYTMARKDGHAVAGIMPLSPEMAASGMPPVWSTYVNVDDLEAAVAKVEPAGGQVMQPPMDVMTAGRMGVITDSTGAVICLWQKEQHIGAELVNDPGCLSWNELITSDPAKAADFYQAVLGWTSESVPMPGGGPPYTVFHVEGASENGIAGAMAPPMEGMPNFWGVYFAVADCDATVETAKAKGATVLAEPMDLEGVGRMAALMDPNGAAFSLMQMAPAT
jgi:hypothetical protein